MTRKEIREIIFKKYSGKCAYCGCALKSGWHMDHFEPIVRSMEKGKPCKKPHNERIDNYNPSCPSCNIQKNSLSIEQFRTVISQFVNSLNLYSTQYKFAKKFNLISENNIEVKFYYETINPI